MTRITKLAGATLLACLAGVTVAAGAIQSGHYQGVTVDDNEAIDIEVGKKPGENGKWVRDVLVEQSMECEEDLHFTKDAKIKQGKFTVKIRLQQLNATIATVKGDFFKPGVISGTLKQVTCDGNEDTYTASGPS